MAEIGQGGQPLLVLADPSLDGVVLRRNMALDEVIVYIRGDSQRRLIAEGTPGSWGMSYSLVRWAWVVPRSTHYRGHNKHVCSQSQGTSIPRGRKMNNKAEEHSKVGSSAFQNQEITIVHRLTC